MDGFRAAVRAAMTGIGWAEPLWLKTRPDDTGARLAREAVRSGVDLVLASGGDGTVAVNAGCSEETFTALAWTDAAPGPPGATPRAQS
jgi:predicted polyphosphate/ATP-dependent NAD kinase